MGPMNDGKHSWAGWLIVIMLVLPFIIYPFLPSEEKHTHTWEIQQVEDGYVTFCKDCGEIADSSLITNSNEQ